MGGEARAKPDLTTYAPGVSELMAARAQMGSSLAFHICFSVLGIGMPIMLLIAEGMWLRTGNVVYPALSQSLVNFAYMGGFFTMPQLLEKGLHYSTSHIGWLVISRPLTYSFVAAAASAITLRIGERRSGVFGASATIVSMFVLSAVGVGSSDWLIILGLALTGVGLGVAGPALTGLIASAVNPADIGTAAAFQQPMMQMGAVTGTTVMTMVHESTLSRGVVESYGYALWVGGLAAFLGLLAALRVQPLRR